MFSVFNFQVRLVKLKSIVLNKTTPHCHNNDSHYPNAHWRVLFSVKLWGSWGKKVSEASGCWAVSRLQHQGRSERVLPANGSSVLTDRWVLPQGWNAQNNTRQNSCCTWSTHTHSLLHPTAIMRHARWSREAAGTRPGLQALFSNSGKTNCKTLNMLATLYQQRKPKPKKFKVFTVIIKVTEEGARLPITSQFLQLCWRAPLVALAVIATPRFGQTRAELRWWLDGSFSSWSQQSESKMMTS